MLLDVFSRGCFSGTHEVCFLLFVVVWKLCQGQLRLDYTIWAGEASKGSGARSSTGQTEKQSSLFILRLVTNVRILIFIGILPASSYYSIWVVDRTQAFLQAEPPVCLKFQWSSSCTLIYPCCMISNDCPCNYFIEIEVLINAKCWWIHNGHWLWCFDSEMFESF